MIASLLPRFNSYRMVREYKDKFYGPASRQWHRFSENEYAVATRLSEWKARVRQAWAGVTIRRLDEPVRRITFSEKVEMKVAVNLAGLETTDVRIELLIGRASKQGQERDLKTLEFQATGSSGNERIFTLEMAPEYCGRLIYHIRVYPYNADLTHPFEMGLMLWL